MKYIITFTLIFFCVSNIQGIERRRDLDAIPVLGLFTTHDFLTTQNRSQILSGMTIQISVIKNGGYFVEGLLSPVQKEALVLFIQEDGSVGLRPEYQPSTLGILSIGPFANFGWKNLDIEYRLGYTTAGDGIDAAEMFMHGLSLARVFKKAWVTRLDMRQYLQRWHTTGMAYSIGIGRRF